MSKVCGERISEPAATDALVPPPLVVDLDGTLLKTDLLIESLLSLLRREPLCLFRLPLWLAGGIACLKHEIARRVVLDLNSLPWRTELIDDLRRRRAAGRSIVLATGNDSRLAHQVADRLNLFDLVLATAGPGAVNLSGEAKRRALVNRFGEKGFDYAASGSSRRNDLAVWASARRALLVNASPHLRKKAARVTRIDKTFAGAGPRWLDRLNALRPAHWLKNLLVFVPLIAAHRADNMQALEKSLLAFVAFSLCASCGYLFNDLCDLEADRHHPHKRTRPFASGSLSLSWALRTIPLLLLGGLILGAAVSPLLLLLLALYLGLSAGYSLRVRSVPVLDVLFLAGLYSLRMAAGTAATGIPTSHWLLAFSTFLFFSLALVKRYAELMVMRRIDGVAAKARGYELSDAELLAAMGTAAGYLSVVILALYIASEHAQVLYAHRELLWFLCPLLLYWISYVWLTAHRGRMLDDPVQFAFRNRTSAILLGLMTATAVVSL